MMSRAKFLLLFVLVSCVTSQETGKSSFNFFPESAEMSLGEQAYKDVLSKNRQSSNPRLTAMIQRVGNRLAAVAKKPNFQWEFRLIESNEKNAFCLPGGKVAFYTGILPTLQNEAGVAVVMGHEIAHATERHGGQRMSIAFGMTSLSVLTAVLASGDDPNNDKKKMILAAMGVGSTLGVILPFSRANESEADEIGLRYAARAGYDPREGSKIWRRMAAEGGSKVPTFLSTHPNSAGRADSLEAQVSQVWPMYEASPKHGLGEQI